MIRPVKLPPGLEPASMNARTVAAEVPTLLVIEFDGGRVYLDDAGNLLRPPRARRDPRSPGGRAQRLRSPHGLRAAAAH